MPQHGTASLTPGAYRTLQVHQKATVTFAPGVYHFAAWDVGQQVNLYFEGPTEVRIAGRLTVDQKSFVGPAPAVGDPPGASEMVIYVAGVNGSSGQMGATPKAAKFGQNTTISANVYVPNGTLWLRQKTDATGAFLGRWVRIGQSVELTLDSRVDRRHG